MSNLSLMAGDEGGEARLSPTLDAPNDGAGGSPGGSPDATREWQRVVGGTRR